MLPVDPYLGLAFHAAFCLALGAGLLTASRLLRYRVRGGGAAVRRATYECGEEPIGPAWGKTHVGFYQVALLFILFDVEAAFLFPWAVSLRTAGPPAFWAMLVFLGVLLLGWVYAWRKGDLDWSR